MKRHRITITTEQRCGTCARPVGWTAFRTRECDCRQRWASGWTGDCDHIVSFLRHWPEPR